MPRHDGDASRLVWWAAVLGAAGFAVAAVLLIDRRNEAPVPNKLVEQRLSAEKRREGTPLHDVYCVRFQALPRSFDCFGEGSDDIHAAYRVTVRPDGQLELRIP